MSATAEELLHEPQPWPQFEKIENDSDESDELWTTTEAGVEVTLCWVHTDWCWCAEIDSKFLDMAYVGHGSTPRAGLGRLCDILPVGSPERAAAIAVLARVPWTDPVNDLSNIDAPSGL